MFFSPMSIQINDLAIIDPYCNFNTPKNKTIFNPTSTQFILDTR